MPAHSPNTGTECPAILLVEDDESAATLLKCALEMADILNRLIRVKDGQEAIEYLRGDPPFANYPTPGLMLLDLKMPRKNGFEVLAWMATRPELKLLPVVVMSTSEEDCDIQMAQQMGAADYQVKPTSIFELVEIVRELHRRWLKPTK